MGAAEQTPNDELLGRSVRALLESRQQYGPSDICGVVDTARALLGAERAHLHVADYALNSLCVLTSAGPLGESYPLEGTMAGRAFTTGEVVATDTTVWIPLVDGRERLGVLTLYQHDEGELTQEQHDDSLALSEVVTETLLSMQDAAPVGTLSAGFDDAVAYRAETYQASGMIAIQLQIPASEALLRIRAHASTTTAANPTRWADECPTPHNNAHPHSTPAQRTPSSRSSTPSSTTSMSSTYSPS